MNKIAPGHVVVVVELQVLEEIAIVVVTRLCSR